MVKGILRPMAVADIPTIGHLFLKVFRRSDVAVAPAFADYLRRYLFGCPDYSEANGSVVYEQEGAIVAAMLALPMRFSVHGRSVTGRLLCAFMTDPQGHSPGAAKITLALRSTRYDFSFSDSASPTSRRHMKAVGATVLPVHGLEWRRVFRPLGVVARQAESVVPGLRFLGLPMLARPCDAAIRRVLSRFVAPEAVGIRDEAMAAEAFVAQAPGYLAHYAFRPVWSREELSWLVRMASENVASGPLRIRTVLDRTERAIGCFVYYGAPGVTAQILNVLATEGRETEVVGAMFRHLDRSGCVGAVGRAQPALLEGLVHQRTLTLRHGAFVCLVTRHADIREAVERGDVYLGGLAGETWSRLMSDFR